MQFSTAINLFLRGNGKNKGKKPAERYASFDYCYNYFHQFYITDTIKEISSAENLQTSCLQLGFYLASWGMLRGSSFLLEKSAKHFIPVITEISNAGRLLWEIDVDTYPHHITDILDAERMIRNTIYPSEIKDHSTILTTKILLGVFANTPAFDTYFKKGMEIKHFNKESLENIHQFYISHQDAIDATSIRTFDFTGDETDVTYSKAKLIDMYGFIKGREDHD